jgi:hypothetical protein
MRGRSLVFPSRFDDQSIAHVNAAARGARERFVVRHNDDRSAIAIEPVE